MPPRTCFPTSLPARSSSSSSRGRVAQRTFCLSGPPPRQPASSRIYPSSPRPPPGMAGSAPANLAKTAGPHPRAIGRKAAPATARPGQERCRAPPSPASGGVPTPSPLYLARCLPPPATLSSPRRVLVILDLNGTLLYRPSRRHPSRFVERPHARPFLSYCLDTFHVAIWSSARPHNVHSMVRQFLTPEQRARCVVVWARDRLGLCAADYDARVQVYKRLSVVWASDAVRRSHPDAAAGGAWDQSNTVLVDDSREKGRSEPYNILPVPEFSGLGTEPVAVLPQVHDYLNRLCYQADVSRYMRRTPFQLDPNYTLPQGP